MTGLCQKRLFLWRLDWTCLISLLKKWSSFSPRTCSKGCMASKGLLDCNIKTKSLAPRENLWSKKLRKKSKNRLPGWVKSRSSHLWAAAVKSQSGQQNLRVLLSQLLNNKLSSSSYRLPWIFMSHPDRRTARKMMDQLLIAISMH